MTTYKVFGDKDERAFDQLKRCAEKGEAGFAVLCADHHPGYSQPIGGAIAYENYISPSGVGYDIGCGNKAVKTELKASDVPFSPIMNEIFKNISFGVGRANDEPVDHPVLDEIENAAFKPQKGLAALARTQLGTVGSGNHYVDLFEDEDGWVWIGVHFGSRGFGHKTASGFLALSQGKEFGEQASEGEMDSPPILFDVHSELGQSYIEAMHLAGRYAYAGRDVVVDKVLSILQTRSVEEIHNHHNFAWQEEHFGKKYWVVRKGCTPAFPGQKGFVGSTMRDNSVILEGVDTEESKLGLYSTVHGAGRLMSRSQAKKLFDFNEERNKIYHEQGVEIRGAGADELPGAYKNLENVLMYHNDTIKILHTLKPRGVAMAGGNVRDPYKD